MELPDQAFCDLDRGANVRFCGYGTRGTPRQSTLNVKKACFQRFFIYNCSESLLNFTCDHVDNLFRSQFFAINQGRKQCDGDGGDEIKIPFFSVLFDIFQKNTRKWQIFFKNLNF